MLFFLFEWQWLLLISVKFLMELYEAFNKTVWMKLSSNGDRIGGEE